MDTTDSKIYQIDKHKQLIPLNGNVVNFTCFFEVKSKDKKQFNIAVVEQGEIKPKQYKLVEDGYINGKIESDGQLKSYFLVLKSQQPCECNVNIVVKPKEAEEPRVQPSPSQQQVPTSPIHHIPPPPPPYNNQNFEPNVMVQQKAESYFQTKYIIGISIAIVLIYLIYRYRKTIFGKITVKDTLLPSISNTSF